MVQALDTLRTLSKNGILDEGSVGIQQYPDVNNAFLSGKVPMVQMGTWYQQYATVDSLTPALPGAGVPADTPKITIVPIPFPDVAGKGNPSTMFADPDAGHSVNAKSKNRNAAITFALWMGGTKEGQQIVVNNMDSFATLNGSRLSGTRSSSSIPRCRSPSSKRSPSDSVRPRTSEASASPPR
jgi:ABC-type glycerol-3-phosphate transport system substrate-binding protein